MTFLIVGASGFVGRHLFARCQAAGHTVVGTQSGMKREELVPFDLRSDRIFDRIPRSVLTNARPTYAVICAGITQIDRCFRERELSYLVNVTNTIRLIRDLAEHDVAPVFVSTGFIFDGVTGGYSETDPPAPVNEYGRQRLEVDRLLAREFPKSFVVRLDKVVGDSPTDPHLFTEWHAAVRAKQPIVCIEGQVFCPTLVDDIAQAIILGCERGLTGVYHVANPERCTRAELARRFLHVYGRTTVVESRAQDEMGFAEPRPLRTYLNVAKFERATSMTYMPIGTIIQRFLSRLREDR